MKLFETLRKIMYSDTEAAPVSVHISAAHVRGEGPKGACRITCQYQRAKANIFEPCRYVAQIPRHLHSNPFFYDTKQQKYNEKLMLYILIIEKNIKLLLLSL